MAKHGFKAHLHLPLWIATSAVSTAALAQSTPTASTSSGTLEEIVITATRRAEELSKVPLSVSAFSERKMDELGAHDIADLARFTPGLSVGLNNSNDIAIRGISSTSGASTTGIYIDDTPIQMRVLDVSPNQSVPELFDLERVEVIRGPQGTLFGAGSEGGTVRYITPQPDLNKSSTYGKAELGFTQNGAPTYEAGIAAGAPLVSGTLAVRGSVSYRVDGGWINYVATDGLGNVTGVIDKNTNHTNTVTSRLALTWAPTDAVSATPSVLFQSRQAHYTAGYWPGLSDPSRGIYQTGGPDQIPDDDRYVLPALKVEVQRANFHLVSNTSLFVRRDSTAYSGTLADLAFFNSLGYAYNADGSTIFPPTQYVNNALYPLITPTGLNLPAGLSNYRAPASQLNTQKNFTQEIRLESPDAKAFISWTAGLFFALDRTEAFDQINDPQLGALTTALLDNSYGTDPANYSSNLLDYWGAPLFQNGNDWQGDVKSHDRQLAGFGQARLQWDNGVKITAGARYAATHFDFQNYSEGPTNGIFNSALIGTLPATLKTGAGSQKETPFTPLLSVSDQINDGNMVYASWSKGYRIGGANPTFNANQCAASLQQLGLSTVPGSYNSDTVSSFEVGSKNQLASRIRLAASAYYINWSGIQQAVYLNSCGYSFTMNLGQAVSKGADLQLDAQLTHALTLELTAGYNDSKLTSTTAVANAGDGLGNSPLTVAVGLNQSFTVWNRDAFVRVDYEYASAPNRPTQYLDPASPDFDPVAIPLQSSHLYTLRAGISLGRMQLSAFVNNLFNTSILQYRNQSDLDYGNPNPAAVVLNFGDVAVRPRTAGITLIYRR